jgi:hypothetical protein
VRKAEALERQVREIVESYDPRITEAAARIDIRVGEDWRGEPAVFVDIVLKDSEAYYVWPKILDHNRELTNRLLEVLPEEYFPFVGFNAESVALDPRVAPV